MKQLSKKMIKKLWDIVLKQNEFPQRPMTKEEEEVHIKFLKSFTFTPQEFEQRRIEAGKRMARQSFSWVGD